MPPSWAIAIASRASVTVSMAADTRGRFRVMLRERRVAREVSLGRTWENAGTNKTSSKVSALPRRRMSELQKKDCTRVQFHTADVGTARQAGGFAPRLFSPAKLHCRHESASTDRSR